MAPAGTNAKNAKNEPAHFGRYLPNALTGDARIESAPSAPGSVTATAGADISIVVTWTPDLVNGDHYTATTTPDSATCTAMTASATTCMITSGLTAGTSYTVAVVAYDASSVASSPGTSGTVVTGAPAAPTGPTATASGTGQVTVAWTAGAANGGIDHYTVSSTPSSVVCTTADNTTTTCNVTGLTPGTSYTFTVVANGSGSVGDSGPSTATTAVRPGPPGAPASVSGAAAAANTVHVTWTAPAQTGNGIDHYTVTSNPGALTCTTPDNTTTSCNVGSLTGGTAYTFTVVANGTGTSGNSAASTASTPVTPGPPGAPTSVTGTATAGNTVTVSWTAPGITGNGIDHYTVTSSPGTLHCTTPDSTTTSCAVTGLTAGTAYAFTVVANGTGTSGNSAASTASTPVTPGPPGPPTSVTGTATAGNTVTVSWTAPGITGNGIDHYTVSSIPSSAGCSTMDGTTTTCDVSVLTAGTPYTFTVVAHGTGTSGNSPTSTASTAVTPGPPAAPTSVTASPGNASALVSWTAPTITGNGIDHYTVTSSPGTLHCTAPTGTSCTVSGLTGGTAYTFTVIANGTGASGNSPASSPSTAVTPGPPGAPTSVMATAGNSAAVVSWTAPTNTGNGIDHYTVTSSPGTLHCTATGATTCTVSGLTGGTAYTFTVIANGTGTTGDSAASSPSATAIPGPPGPPTAVAGAASAGSTIHVTWTAPTITGNGIAHYTVTSTPSSSGCTTADGSTTGCDVSGLTAGTPYTFTVVANGVTGTGDSPASTVSAAVTPGPPGTPTAVAAASGNTQLVVSWTAPANLGGGIAHYTATTTPGAHTCDSTGTATTCTITGLTNGTGYSVTVKSVGTGSSGTSADSTAASGTPSSAPGAPTSAAAAAGIESATVAWSAPTSTGSGVLKYVATATPGDRTCMTADATSTTCAITGLTAGTAYTVTVVARGTYGADSAASTATQAITPTAPVPATVPSTVPSSDGPVGSSGGGTLTAEQTVTLTGSGYKPNTTITVAIYSSPTVLGTATTDGTGSFSMQVTLPSGVSGSHTLVAAGLAPDNSVRYTTLAVTVAATGSGGGNLAVTGAPSQRIALGGVLLVLLGIALVVVSKRRRVWTI